MEPRFGQDFSGVRLHTGAAAQASAAAEGALAYAAGGDVVFGAGQYRPDTVDGRFLIAHELAHVVQQRGSAAGTGAEAGALERQAGEAGMRVTLGGTAQVSAGQGGPAVQFLRVSNGGFGKALEEFTETNKIEDKAVTLLKQSATFMSLVATLDSQYAWYRDPIYAGQQKLELGPDGRVVKPATAAGKRAILVSAGGGARFSPYAALPDNFGFDFISIGFTDTPTFIQDIAHEASHAAAFVGGSAPQPQLLVDEIRAGIQDEIKARASEAKILGEIRDPKVKADFKPVGSRDAWQVERDFSPGLNLTYLEAFFFARELRDAQAAENLTEDQAAKIRKEIDDLLPPAKIDPRKIDPRSEYGWVWLRWKRAVRYWEEFNKTHSPGASDFEAKKEEEIQDHARRFFEGKVSYTPKPPKPPNP